MCGIAGVVDFSCIDHRDDVLRMAKAQTHRGPDGNGVLNWAGPHASVSLSHTRLAILDLSTNGSQPMSFGELAIAFNGEVYNYRELQAELSKLGHCFHTKSDTEVLLHAFFEWGPDSFQRLVGMFAFALLDKQAGKVYLVRDRLGVKPLHLFTSENNVFFASELKGIVAGIKQSLQLDQASVYHFFEQGVIPGEETIYQYCRKVAPGTFLVFDLASRSSQKQTYWRALDAFMAPKSTSSFSESVNQLEELLVSACNYRMISDVPVGMFLSGGYDSATVAAIVQKSSKVPLNTFTIGFHEGNNEAAAAAKIASHIGSHHHEFYCSPREAREILADLPNIFDEPFGDSSAIPTVLVSRMARKIVKVALSADGGDELFGGYPSYLRLQRIYRRLSSTPGCLKWLLRCSTRSLQGITKQIPSRYCHLLNVFLSSLRPSDDATCSVLHSQSHLLPGYLMRGLFTADFKELHFNEDHEQYPSLNFLNSAMLQDTIGYLPDDILVKVDRATMSTGLEGREPLLDHRLFEFAARLPIDQKIDRNQGKLLLREIAHRYLPRHLMERPKTGFSVPVINWLRGELRDLLEEFCSPAALTRTGLLNVQFVRRKLDEFYKNQLYYTPLIWRVFVFQQWSSRWLP